MENKEGEKKRESKVLAHRCRLRKLGQFTKHKNIHFIGIQEYEERDRRFIFDQIVAGNVLNLGKT